MDGLSGIILASKSPRRKEILSRTNARFKILVSDRDEPSFDGKMSPSSFASLTADSKLRNILSEYHDECENSLILAYDTVVCLGNVIYGKPHDFEDAFRMLKTLSGKTHCVFTGFSFYFNGEKITGAEKTEVSFRNLSDEEIKNYIETEKPFDKAGAYGIQEGAGKFVSSVSGDYDNVVGLPLERTVRELRSKWGISFI